MSSPKNHAKLKTPMAEKSKRPSTVQGLPLAAGVECPICENSRSRSLFNFKSLDVVECEHCSMVYVPTPAPEFIAIYKEDYYSSQKTGQGYQNYRSEFSNHLMTFSKRLEESENRLGRIGRLLDVGCALGHMGEAAKRRSWDVYVTDVSEYAVHESRDQFGLNAFVSGPEKLPVKEASFDLITLYDVVEHLSHPADLLKNIKNSLCSDGLVHIVTPNINSFSARLMGRHWYHLKPEEHLLYFTPETLGSLLERCGFEVVKIKPVPTFMRIHDILLRLERYSRGLVRIARWATKLLGLSDLRVKIYVGEMQAWARPAHVRVVRPIKPVVDILDIVCCPNCRSEIQLFEEVEAICTQCELQFEVNRGVINFSRYAKRTNKQVSGSS